MDKIKIKLKAIWFEREDFVKQNLIHKQMVQSID